MTQSFYEFFCPVKVVSGTAALEHVPFELSMLGSSKPLIITDKGVRAAGLVDTAISAFEGADLDVRAIYDDVPPDSSIEVVQAAAALYRDAFKGRPFVRVLEAAPELTHCVGTNLALIHAASSDDGLEVQVSVAVDNLVKGAGGQAVQCMNLALGLDETAGLGQVALFP